MRRNRLGKVAEFKQGITDEQLIKLRDRQFVIVDEAKVYGHQKRAAPETSKDKGEAAKRRELRVLQHSMEEQLCEYQEQSMLSNLATYKVI